MPMAVLSHGPVCVSIEIVLLKPHLVNIYICVLYIYKIRIHKHVHVLDDVTMLTFGSALMQASIMYELCVECRWQEKRFLLCVYCVGIKDSEEGQCMDGHTRSSRTLRMILVCCICCHYTMICLISYSRLKDTDRFSRISFA